jgi:hypothetical protein
MIPHLIQGNREWFQLFIYLYSSELTMAQGTHRFMSVNVLENCGPHTYLDDLESFFYVLCWIVTAFPGPGQMMIHIPRQLSRWDREIAPDAKAYMFYDRGHRLPLQEWFGHPIHTLISRLLVFFADRCNDRGKLLSESNPAADYNEYLSHIRACMVDLEAEALQ